MKKRLITAGAVILVLTVFIAGVYYRITGHNAAQATSSTGPQGDLPDVSATEQFATDLAVMVEGAPVVLDTLVLSVTAAGEAASPRKTTLRAQVSGQVRRVHVGENRNVAAGAVLLEIDPTEYQLAVDEARAGLRRAEATYQEITLGDDRIEDARVRAARDSAARARSGLESAQVALERAQINLRRTRVQAPFPGTVADLKVVVGQYVNAGEELLVVQSMDPIRVEAQVLEGEIGFLQAGRTAIITFAAFPGETFEGVIESINPVVEQQTRTARVTVVVRNPGGRILPGMYARVSLAARRFADRVLVPREAILERDSRFMLFVFEGEDGVGRAKWRYVNPGLMNDRYVELLREGPENGFAEPGETVLVYGHYTLTHDIQVRLVEDARQGGRAQ
jgi:membrane fusion protein, multidrug efflux system